ncbi:MAG TPA: tRNA (adenosine(37)-N6)-dimethylallyltransferase MiaA [Anaerolineaceae bacterium]|uniref:tRNA dimethylallyltransferase n=1 Tax=Anaerolinea thermophila TaxID=167964 RepID=A0A101FZD7_9CHLR|nr:MAG: tRNA delta(2)-isopentenylpyrophosphate transferase [Anaerolinea thermophila]HAF61077.1 tRNA (adenosine(37)-N6)-dimethylallyltransferase MiaA [Anaerolineaceae bacterium]
MNGLKMQLPVTDPVIVMVGPTAVGKTTLAIGLAQRFSAEIISLDSRYLYKGMNIGTAKPTIEEMQGVTHHLIDIAEPDEPLSLPQIQQQVTQTIVAIKGRGNIPFMVGGTGQYVWSVVEGWLPPPAIPNMRLREVLEEMAGEVGASTMYDYVALLDPEAARKIEPNNVRRTIRALEVIFSTGELFSDLKRRNPPHHDFKIIGLQRPRQDLYKRVDQRIDQMIADGIVEETEMLLRKGFSPDLPSMTAIGYKEITQYLEKEISLEEAVRLMKRRTRIFIRHQANWFKQTDERIQWFEMTPQVLTEIATFISSTDGWINNK